jgi:hypothetical protein
MLLEDLLLAVAVGVVLLLFGVPIIRFLKVAPWRRRDPLAEAQERHRLAKLEAEAARLNRETEKIYESMYEETVAKERVATGTRIAPENEAVQALDEPTEKGRRNGQG